MLWAPTSQPGLFWSTSPLLLHLLLMSSLLIITVVSPHTSKPPTNMYNIVLDESASSAIDVCLEPRGAIQCPPPCPANSTTQCLYYLKESHKEEVCGRGLDDDAITSNERRRALNMLRDIRMRHCCEHQVEQALPDDTFIGTRATCRNILQHLLDIDHFIGRTVCGHARVLTRYDCTQVYSIVHRCEQCKEAYRRWVCSSLVPHYGNRVRQDADSGGVTTAPTTAGNQKRVRIRPCLSVCQDVEQQCPYLLPGDWTNLTLPPGENAAHPTPQYAGEPTFLCLDPNIPETGLQKRKSWHGDEDCCYTHCGSPGRGTTTDNKKSSASSRLGTELFSVCEHCPGRPNSPSSTASSAASSSSSSTASSLFSKTRLTTIIIDRVSLIIITWTAWIIYSNMTVYRRRRIIRRDELFHLIIIIISIIIIMKCLLCATTSVIDENVVRLRTNIWTETLSIEKKCEGTCS